MKPISNFNTHGVKDSCNQYRNIKGKHYICMTSDPNLFEEVRREAKEKGLSTRIIKGEIYLEVKEEVNLNE